MLFRPGRTIIRRPVPLHEPALQPLRRQLRNAGGAVKRVASALVKGKGVWLTPARAEEQRAICTSNKCGLFRESDQRCGHPDCNCFTKLKAMLATERCPVGLWSSPDGPTKLTADNNSK